MNDSEAHNELTRLTLVCDEFSRRLKETGASGLIAEFLRGVPDRHATQLFSELLALEVRFRRSRGETPQADEYLPQFPVERFR